MAYVYINDGAPEAEEYDSNYFVFDESNRESMALIEKMLASHDSRDEAFRAKLRDICADSFNHKRMNRKQRPVRSGRKRLGGWFKSLNFLNNLNYVRDLPAGRVGA